MNESTESFSRSTPHGGIFLVDQDLSMKFQVNAGEIDTKRISSSKRGNGGERHVDSEREREREAESK